MSRMLSATVIIPTRNRADLVADAVRSVLAGRRVPEQLVIVDQSDRENEQLQSLANRPDSRLVYVRQQTRGLSRARNAGIAVSKSEVLIFLDDDMLVADGWYEWMLNTLISCGPNTVVTGRVLAHDEGSEGGFAPALVTSTTRARYKGRIGTDVLAGGNMAAFRSVFDCIGYFDERLGAGSRLRSAEDNDLGFRLLESGYEIVYTPDAIAYHRTWRSADQFLQLRWAYGCGKGGFYLKHCAAAPGEMIPRVLKDIGRRVIYFPGRLIYNRRCALGDAAYTAGLIWGACIWTVHERHASPTSFIGGLEPPMRQDCVDSAS